MQHLHRWDLSITEAKEIQKELAPRVLTVGSLPEVELVAGADISYNKFSPKLYASVVVWKRSTGEIMEVSDVLGESTFPYVPGYLSFREAPTLLRAFAKLESKPDVVMVDGQGIAHPRRFGIACHLGLWLDLPTIGCAKSRLVGTFVPPDLEAGSVSDLTDRGEVIGQVVRTKKRTNPLFIAPGHRIDLESAVRVVMQCCRGYRIPEPTRQAHLRVNDLRTKAKE